MQNMDMARSRGSDAALRAVDITAAIAGLAAGLPIMLPLIAAIRLTSPGPAIYRQERVGRFQKPFVCLKFRTMRADTPIAATHLTPASAVTPLGHVLRATKFDELPQLWNVLVGEMSLVGPRPCLPRQTELIAERERFGLHAVRPGITGPAQIMKVDMSDPQRLARLDADWLSQRSVANYLKIVALTILGRGAGDRVRVSDRSS
jgi:lipopolysaccharide/colanic/teichoic acid biosynthesis glycosyltransferase